MEQAYEKKKKFIINIIYIALIVFIVYVILKYGLGLLSPFLFAVLIAYFLRRPSRFISRKSKLPYKIVSAILVLLFFSTIGVLISLLGIKLISTITVFVSEIPVVYESQIEPFLISAFDWIEQAVYRMDPNLFVALNEVFNQFIQSLGDIISSVSMRAVKAISGYASSLPGFFIKLVIMVISTFFIAIDYDKISEFVLRQFTGKSSKLILDIKKYVIDTLFVYIRSYAMIMSITFVELSIGLLVLNIDNAVIIALLISIFDILPILGTGGIMIPWTILTFIQGDFKMGIGLAVMYFIVTIVRNIVEPRIVGKRIGIHPVATLAAMFLGARFFGVLGLFGFPITLSLLRHLNDTGTIKLFE